MQPATGSVEEAFRELRSTQRRLADILDSIAEYLFAIDRECRFTFVNRQMMDFLGKPIEEIIGRSLWDLFPGSRETEFYPQYLRVLNERVPVSFELLYVPSGKWLQVRAHPTEEGLTAYVVDIDARKQAEEAVLRSERRFRALIENSSDGIMITDGDGKVQYTGRSLMGREAEKETFIGINTLDTLHPEDRARVRDAFAAMSRTPEASLTGEYRARHSDGSWRWVDVRAKNLLHDPDVGGIVLNYRDITERKRFEEQFRQTQKLESLGVLAGGIAHDFNNLLVGIMGNASLALDGLPGYGDVRQRVEEILAASEQAANLTRQMLAYSGRGQFVIEPIDLSELVREMAKLLHTSVPRNVELVQDLAIGLPYIEADRAQIQQLLMNFVINGAEAIGEKHGTVSVRTGVEDLAQREDDLAAGRCVLLEVRDTGSGMDEETARKIFDPFFTTKTIGRGLGLAAAQGIVRGHKGTIRIRTAPGQGTTFTVLFPAAVSETPTIPHASAPGDLAGLATILVVDDEDIVRRLAKTALEHRGYRTVVARNGQEALEIFGQNPDIALVLLDLSMPVMGGEECWSELRAIRPDIRVILSSGYNEADAFQRFSGKGLSGFIQKPYTATRLAAIVKAALEEQTA
jgi:PAS domain S-box-containing protein